MRRFDNSGKTHLFKMISFLDIFKTISDRLSGFRKKTVPLLVLLMNNIRLNDEKRKLPA